MSILSLFFVFLFCFTTNSVCKARHIRIIHKGTFDAQLHYSTKVKLERDLIIGGTNGGSDGIANNKGHGGVKTSHEHEKDSKELKYSSIRAKNSGVVPKKPLVSVSWRVPSKSYQENHPGFHLDYSRPRTRPPSHN